MKKETTSFGTCKIASFKTSNMYAAHCDCGSHEHIQTLDVTLPWDDSDTIGLDIYTKIYTPIWPTNYDDPWHEKLVSIIKNRWWRVKAAAHVLWFGWLEGEASFNMSGEERIDAYINAILEGKAKMQEFLDKRRRRQRMIDAGIMNEDGDINQELFPNWAAADRARKEENINGN